MLETAGLNSTELGAYCRERGLLPEQVDRSKAEACEWRASFVDGSTTDNDTAICQQRAHPYDKAHHKHTHRWSRSIRCWGQKEGVWINKQP